MLATSCPMMQQGIESMAAMNHQNHKPQAHDCCADKETATKTGKLCNPGQNCQTCAQYPALFDVSFDWAREQISRYALALVLTIPSFDAMSVWRPPTRA